MSSVSGLEGRADRDERLSEGLPLVDVVGIGSQPELAVRSAVIKAGGRAASREWRPGGRSLPKLSGVVLIVDAHIDGAALHLLLSDIRGGTDARIILILPRASSESRLMARLHGADHVVGADVDPRELAAIIRNEIRHHARGALVRPVGPARAGEEQHRWHLDEERWSLVAPNQCEIRLTHSEFGMLRILVGQPGVVQPRRLLRAAIDGDPSHSRVLDTVISRLRRKVWDCAHMELPLRSARGEGYVFASNGLI
ncbi:response regulator transcription factor [Sphingomonas abietis]|uniref:Winged helix-turn-helix domain-containing protein n=1 Tax=Sphingomonas abietis TaxID=3012344 RepID=A0ABY7NRW3_9SPHN|nr:winged helix-turn-helix domain-containing protein [Sphingomonas abietis]WBO23705.1 winged helix-turn-helix domain-containing protein [Sphingomonas abietis]